MPEQEEKTINALDSHIVRLQHRVNQINDNLHDGLFGEQPTDEDKEDASAMPTPSIASLSRRLEDLSASLNYTEDYVRKIHGSNEKVGFATPSSS